MYHCFSYPRAFTPALVALHWRTLPPDPWANILHERPLIPYSSVSPNQEESCSFDRRERGSSKRPPSIPFYGDTPLQILPKPSPYFPHHLHANPENTRQARVGQYSRRQHPELVRLQDEDVEPPTPKVSRGVTGAVPSQRKRQDLLRQGMVGINLENATKCDQRRRKKRREE